MTIQMKTRDGKTVRTPIKHADEIYEREFTKGEASGIELFLRMPEQLIESARLEVEVTSQTGE